MSDSLKFPNAISMNLAVFDRPSTRCLVFFGMEIDSPPFTLKDLFPTVTFAGLSKKCQNSLRVLCVCKDKRFFGLTVIIFTVVFSFKVNCSNCPHGLLSIRWFFKLFFIIALDLYNI